MKPLNNLLQDLLARLDTDPGDEIVIYQREVLEWPDGALDALLNAGLLIPLPQASEIYCPGCEEDCWRPVECYPQTATQKAHYFIVCDRLEETPRVTIEQAGLQQWQLVCNREKIASVGGMPTIDTSKIKKDAQRKQPRSNSLEIGSPEWREQTARNAANAKHDRPGGSRDMQKQMREIWATGKYTSRDRCAEEECGALGISFSAARKALKNTPNP